MSGVDRERELETLEGRATVLDGETRRLLELIALRPREALSAHRQFDFFWAELKAIRAVLAAEDALGVALAGLVELLEDAAYGGPIVPAAAGPGASERPDVDQVATASERDTADPELEQLEEEPQ